MISSNSNSEYPVPLSPPLPAISKEIEVNRAMTASSKSSLFLLTNDHIVFEDEWLIVVNKPMGVYCECVLASVPQFINTTTTAPQGFFIHTILFVSANTIKTHQERVKINHSQSMVKGTMAELHLANRLDRDTSGLMVITKSHKVASKLVRAFTDHKVRKTYLALCIGSAPNWETVAVKSGHGRSKYGVWRVYAASNVGRSLPGGSVVREMSTTFQLLSVNGKGSFKEPIKSSLGEEENYEIVQEWGVKQIGNSDEILVRAYPHSGRTHQIRLHCHYLGISIRGDVKYEGVHEWKGITYDGHSLHAETLMFDHPVTGYPVEFMAPYPCWAQI